MQPNSKQDSEYFLACKILWLMSGQLITYNDRYTPDKKRKMPSACHPGLLNEK